MADATELQRRLDGLEKAIASGVRSVSFDGNTTTYGSTAEMMRAAEYVRRQIASLAGKKLPVAGKASFSRI